MSYIVHNLSVKFLKLYILGKTNHVPRKVNCHIWLIKSERRKVHNVEQALELIQCTRCDNLTG